MKIVSIVIPAYNEERNIAETFTRVVREVTVPAEVILVLDHCTDRTEEIARGFEQQHPQITIIRNTRDRGFGNTLITGIEHATGEFLVPVMADCCDDPSTINRMHEVLATQPFDVVCASRYMRGGRKVSGPWVQDKLSRLVCFTLRLVTRVPTRDCANSYKMYRRAFLDTLNYRIAGAGTEYSMALLFRAYYSGARITEIPTTWTGKQIPFTREWKIFRRTGRYWRWYKKAVGQALRFLGLRRRGE